MEMSSVLNTYRKLQKKNIKFVDYSILERVTNLTSKNSLYKLAYRMKEKDLLVPLNGGGKFVLAGSNPTEFEIANFIYQPSYVSLESALSFYGILSQFVYSITSVTTRKTKEFVFSGKEYQFSSIKDDLYWGYVKKNNFLIAEAEKALLDSLYFHSKGLVKLNLSELDLSDIDKKSFKTFEKKFNNKAVDALIKELKL